MAADLLANIGPTSILIAETLAAAIHFQSDLYFGDPQNAVGPIGEYARVLGVHIIVVAPST